MKTRTLNGAWTLEIPGTPFAAVPATVPGSVYHDLLAAERIPDPFYRDNEMEALKLMDNDFVYFRSFQVDDALLRGQGFAPGRGTGHHRRRPYQRSDRR